MKKLTTFIFLMLFSNAAIANSEFSLFSINLFDPINMHLNQNQINEKSRNPETDGSYFYVSANNLRDKNSQFDHYFLTIDQENIIHEIYALRVLNSSIENCVKRTAPTLVKIFEEKYAKKMNYGEFGYADFNIYEFAFFDKNKSKLRVQCNLRLNSKKVAIIITLESNEILESKVRYYEKGLN